MKNDIRCNSRGNIIDHDTPAAGQFLEAFYADRFQDIEKAE